MQDIFQLARARLATISVIIGEVVGSGIALLFYFTFLVPFALISRLSTDPLRRRPNGTTFWQEREAVPTTLQRAQRQG